MFGAILKLIVSRKLSNEVGKIAAEVNKTDPEISNEFKKVQQDIKQLESNMDWYCRANPDSPLCKKREPIKYKLRRK
jgi:phage host-nuclease inhibitor protein Gam